MGRSKCLKTNDQFIWREQLLFVEAAGISALRQLLIFMAFTLSVATQRRQNCSSFVPENSKNCILANDSCSLLPPVFHMLRNGLILSLPSSIPLGSSYKLQPMNMFFNEQKDLFYMSQLTLSFITRSLFFMAIYHRGFLMNHLVP